MAALCVIEGRQHQLLNDDVRTELSRGNRDADSIKKALLPVERDLGPWWSKERPAWSR
ncbi:hypothetical protein RKD26_006782 [Streptomyces calvus]